MTTLYPVAQQPLAFPGPPGETPALFFDVRQTVISQYANSPVMLALLGALNTAIDQQANIDAFYDLVWDVSTAVGFGLDIWGRIVGVSRTLYLADGDYLGFSEATTAETFGSGIFYSGAHLTSNYALTDLAYRRVILAKAALNITNGSTASINTILMALFPDHGNCYVRDNLDMTMTYVFGATLSAVEYAIVTQSGVLPRPIGVSVDVEQP